MTQCAPGEDKKMQSTEERTEDVEERVGKQSLFTQDPRGRKKDGAETASEETMADHFPELLKDSSM